MPFASRLMSIAIILAAQTPASAESSFGRETICRTALAAIHDRDPKRMQIDRKVEDVLFLTYARPFDNFVWAYRCRIEGDRVIWADEPGRWRDQDKDDKIFFEIVGGAQLRITERRKNGSSPSELFDRDAIE